MHRAQSGVRLEFFFIFRLVYMSVQRPSRALCWDGILPEFETASFTGISISWTSRVPLVHCIPARSPLSLQPTRLSQATGFDRTSWRREDLT